MNKAKYEELFIEEQFLTKDSYRKQVLHSLEECFEYYDEH